MLEKQQIEGGYEFLLGKKMSNGDYIVFNDLDKILKDFLILMIDFRTVSLHSKEIKTGPYKDSFTINFEAKNEKIFIRYDKNRNIWQTKTDDENCIWSNFPIDTHYLEVFIDHYSYGVIKNMIAINKIIIDRLKHNLFLDSLYTPENDGK